MWLKLIVGGLVILFCTLLGYFAAGKYRARKQFYEQFAYFNDRFLNELGYGRKPLAAFSQENIGRGDFGKTVKGFIETRNAEFDLKFLKEEEREEAKHYFSMLGRSDVDSQKKFCSSQKSILEEKKLSSEREAKTHGELYLKLGLIAGLAIVILIV